MGINVYIPVEIYGRQCKLDARDSVGESTAI